MTRTSYIFLLNNNQILSIIYRFYEEECYKQNKAAIEPNLFSLVFTMWGNHAECTRKVLDHYNKIHDPRQVILNNQIIKYF